MMRKRKIIGIIGLVLILVIVLFYVVRIQPMVKEYKKIAYDKLANIDEDTFAKLENTKVYGKNGELIGEVNSGSYQYKKISEISKYVQDGYIAVEDKNFKSHHGIDYLATVRAGIKLVLNRGKATQGGSTITQQLVKNSFLSQEKTFTRKIAEFFLAPEIEKMYTKPQIMEYYCNSNYYGNRCYGIGNAASYYFHKNADQLTLSEAALLVGLSNNPSRYDPVTNYNSSIRKRDRVLKHMLDAKVISKTQYQQAKNEKIEIAEYRKNVKPEGYQTSFAIYQATLELMKKNGFATLENGGVYQDNSCIDKIMFKDHEVLKHKNTRKNVYSSASAYMITDCMKDAVKNGTGKNAQVKGQIIAGKTGTTNDYKDAWFCGYSRYYTTSVWVGCDDSKPMDNLTGSSYPSKIFSDYMTKVHKGKIKKDFKMPNTVYRKDGDLFSKDIDDTLHETVLENILKEQIKKAENAVEDFEAFTITDGESAYLLDDKYQKVCTAIEKVDDSTQKAKFRQRIEDHYDNLLEEQKKWKDAMETYVTQKEQQRIAENEKAEKEAVQKRQVYEQQQNIKLVKSYISRLDVMDTYDDTAEDIITKLQEALKKCEDYDTYDELNQKAEQAIERVRNLNSDTTTTESN